MASLNHTENPHPSSPSIAFDTSRYHHSSPTFVAADLASLTTEAKTSPHDIDAQRIWWFNSFPNHLSSKPEDIHDSIASLEAQRLIRETPPNSQRLVLLVSPPSPQFKRPESRIDIYLADNQQGEITFDAYGIPAKWDSSQVCELANRFQVLSDLSHLPPLSESDLVLTPISLTFNEPISNWGETGQLFIPLPSQIWNQISTGEIKHRSQQLTEQMIPIAQGLLGNLESGMHPTYAGAQAEQQAINISGPIDTQSSGCGILNLDLIDTTKSTTNSTPLEKVTVKPNFRVGEKYLVRNCGKCCGTINSELTYGLSHCPHCRELFGPKQNLTSNLIYESSPQTESILLTNMAPVTAWAWLPEWWSKLPLAA